ncbi:MAG: ribosome-binding factor A [Desulfuromonadales bacterium]|nr:ribosome-binding factor A [Desulfuromonadales bacterium]
MSTQRAQRVAETIHHEISQLLIRGLKDPRIGFVTITGVDVTSDLRSARVYYTVIGDDDSRTASAAGLKSSIPYLRQQLGKVLRLRFVPELVFAYDSSVDYGNRIEELLREVKPADE